MTDAETIHETPPKEEEPKVQAEEVLTDEDEEEKKQEQEWLLTDEGKDSNRQEKIYVELSERLDRGEIDETTYYQLVRKKCPLWDM